MNRVQHLNESLATFVEERKHSTPLFLETVWHFSWSKEHVREVNRETRWRHAAGVYIFIDFCSRSDRQAEGRGERYSVIRRVGKANSHFGDRLADYCHRVFGGPGRQTTWYKSNGTWREWFRYAQIDVVRTTPRRARELESFLLRKIPTECNDLDVPDEIRHSAIIYDSYS